MSILRTAEKRMILTRKSTETVNLRYLLFSNLTLQRSARIKLVEPLRTTARLAPERDGNVTSSNS